MKNSLFISFLALVLSSCSKFICVSPNLDYKGTKDAFPGLFGSNSVRKFQTTIKYRSAEMTGIMIVKKLDDTHTAGSFVNEFGIKGFDFRISPDRVEFSYLINKLDKWYIRRSLGNDLHFLFLRPEMKYYCSVDGKPAMVNKISHSLTFVFFISGEPRSAKAEMLKRNHKYALLEQSDRNDDMIILRMQHVDGSISYELNEFNN